MGIMGDKLESILLAKTRIIIKQNRKIGIGGLTDSTITPMETIDHLILCNIT
jgi:hypothetical protein